MSLQTLIEQCLGEHDAQAMAHVQRERWAAWLAPISADQPTGEDPGYDDDFQSLREEVNKLSGADAGRVIAWAETLLKQRCKDVRVASYYVWARLHRDGEVGLGEGLSLLAALVERYPNDLLPSRPNSRKMALEWLTSARVLDSLTLFPEVVKSEAQQTVSALVWLEQGLEAWPFDQRPALGALYGALAARLKQSGGVDALVPQHSVSQESTAPPVFGQDGIIKSGRELLDTGRKLVTYLCDQPQGWLAAHRVMKSLRWDTVHQAPMLELTGNTRLTAPRSDYRAHLKRLYVQQNWTELLDQAQRVFSESVNHFWLDLQWYVYQALSKQPAPQDSWASMIAQDLTMFLERLPGIETLYWADGSPFADPTTREWIAQHVCAGRASSWPASLVAEVTPDAQIFALEGEALAQADSMGVEPALHWLITHPDAQHNGRQRWLVRLLMARVAEQCGKGDLAFHLLNELDVIAQRQALDHWEPALSFEVKARLLKALRLKVQRNDVDKTAVSQRMESVLAGLVAIDPVRAAVLCG